MSKPLMGIDVFFWPEFQALAKRLGVDVDLPIREVSLHLVCDGEAIIKLKYLGEDKRSEDV